MHSVINATPGGKDERGNRYTYTQESFIANQKIEAITIDEMDSTIVLEFSDKYNQIKVNYRDSKEVDEIRYNKINVKRLAS